MDIDWDRAVLLPIDMQQGFDTPQWPRRWNAQSDANGLALLKKWREEGRPIIHVRHDSVVEGSTLNPDSPGNQIRALSRSTASNWSARASTAPLSARTWI